MSIPFTKMQGLGNDFVVIDAIRHPINLTPDLVQSMANRHFGIGFDQLLIVEPAKHPEVDFEFRIFNCDGTEVEQCGNGARCVARFLWDSGLTHKEQVVLGTKFRNLEVSATDNQYVAVNMGVPLFDSKDIPFLSAENTDSHLISLDDLELEIGVVNVGNPHAVILVEDINKAPVKLWGPKLGKHPRFPQGVNVNFLQLVDRQNVRLRVYERGAGETLACGSGACAAVAFAGRKGLVDQEVQVQLKGGILVIRWSPGGPIWMTGPTERVFRGEWLLKF